MMGIIPIGILVNVRLKVPNRMMGSAQLSFQHHNYPTHPLELIFCFPDLLTFRFGKWTFRLLDLLKK